ncbi:MAG: ATP synthase F1 subunit delta [Bacteroidetes bacterium]|nr:ATP synthase F1 subunit delta [Bacteroidota bacterium]MCH7769697.1 ATP synthase F1 subunit delta [Bacteroidota bacterium]
MPGSKVLNRYAITLLEIALEKNNLDIVHNDIKLLINTFDKSSDLKRVVESPVIKPDVKISILNEIFSKQLNKDTLDFVHFIVNKRREEILYPVAKRFIELRNEHLGIVELKVSTAFTLSDAEITDLKNKFETILNKKVTTKFTVDNNLIGGFIARVGDTVYNASVKHQLSLLKKEFTHSGLSLN